MDNCSIPKGWINPVREINSIPSYEGFFSNPSKESDDTPSKRELYNSSTGGNVNPSMGCLSNPSKGGDDTSSKGSYS